MSRADDILRWLAATGTRETVEGMARFGIPSNGAFGVTVGEMRRQAKAIGPDHEAARALWADGRYEARMMAVLIGEPDVLTSEEADAWCADFDNWAICDTACFALFDRTDFRWEKVALWAVDPREFVRRAGFALVWALTTHDKKAENARFEAALALIEQQAGDERPLVKKAIDMALRATGKRNYHLHDKALAACGRLETREERAAQWIGRHARSELESAKVLERLSRKAK
ncbi:MAG: DNA alkylation repair protein [Pseudomonadota bacterium]